MSRSRPPTRALRPGEGQPAGPALGEQVEGRQAVLELLRARKRPVREVLVSASESGTMAEIVGLAGTRGIPLRRLDRAELQTMARSDAPQGVIAWADPLAPVGLGELAAARPGAPQPFLVVLDGVTDPHNLGAIMRSALGAGATGLVIGRHRAAGMTPTAVKAAAGAAEHLPVAIVGGIPQALTHLGDHQVWTVALEPGAAQTLWELDLAAQPVALVLGSEGSGISRLVRQRCDIEVSIPLHPPLASLNVSAAATLACFEIARKRSRSWRPN